jgi:hypothetical protein
LVGPWPSGDPERMDEGAAAWKDLASALDTAWGDTQRYTAYVLSDNQGDAADAFDQTVQELIDPRKGTLTHALQACEQLQQACTNQAQAIRDIKRELEFLLAELVATFIIGQVVSAITFESAQVASDAITAGLIGRIAKLISDFSRGVIEISSAMDKAIAGVIAKGIVGAGTSVYAGGLNAGANYAISEAFGKKPGDWSGPDRMSDLILVA